MSELCPAGQSEGYEIRDDEVARRELRPATQILRAGNTAKSNKYASPVMGVLGGGRHGGGRLCRTADCARPLAVLKVNCPKGAREGGLGHW